LPNCINVYIIKARLGGQDDYDNARLLKTAIVLHKVC